jgi:hypothetical protein
VELATVVVSAANAFAQISAAEKALSETKNQQLQAANIPGLAQGGMIETAGSVLVGERGRELLTLPRGATVTPLSDQRGGNVYHISIEINNPIFTPDNLTDQLVQRIGPKLSQFIDVERERL